MDMKWLTVSVLCKKEDSQEVLTNIDIAEIITKLISVRVFKNYNIKELFGFFNSFHFCVVYIQSFGETCF